MPTPTKGPRLGGGPAHERLMLANLATSLFEHGRITTTEAKAKRLRPLAERLITFAKRGDLHARRQVMTVVRDKDVVHKLFAEIGPRFAERPGGYTRIIKVGPRKGDNAPMAVIELVEGLTVAQEAVGEAERARGTRFQPAGARPSAGPRPPRPRPSRRPRPAAAGRGRGRGRRPRRPRRPRPPTVCRGRRRRRPARPTADRRGRRRRGRRRLPAEADAADATTPTDAAEARRRAVRRGRGRRRQGLTPHRTTTSPPLPPGTAGSSASGWTSPTTAPTSPAGPRSPGGAPCRASSRRRWPRCCGCPVRG